MADNRYDVGDGVRITGSFTNTANVPADPTTVTLTVTNPSGVTSTPSVVKDATGAYHADITVNAQGLWKYEWDGVGAIIAVSIGTLVVGPLTTLSPLALTTLVAARSEVLKDATDSSQDERLIRYINAYSRAAFAYTRREWLPQTNAASRRFMYDGAGFLSLEPYDLRTVTSVTLYTDLPVGSQRILSPLTLTGASEFRGRPFQKTDEGTFLSIELPTVAYGTGTSYFNNPYPFGPVGYGRSLPSAYEVTILGDWGIGIVPDDVELAVLIAVADAFRNPEGFSSRTLGEFQVAEEPLPTGADARAGSLPAESRALLSPYKRSSGVAVA